MISRATLIEDDPGYGPHVHTCQILLDGEPQSECVLADCEFGIIVKYKIGPDGCPVHNGETFVYELVRGLVKIVPMTG